MQIEESGDVEVRIFRSLAVILPARALWILKMWMRNPKPTLYLLTAAGVLTFQVLNPPFPSFSHHSSNFPEKISATIHGLLRSSRAISAVRFSSFN